jgi:hypothetical protein
MHRLPILLIFCLVFFGAECAEHPRLLVGPSDVTALRAKAQREPFASMIAAMQKAAGTPPASLDGSGQMYDTRPRDLAALYAITGNKMFAAEAEKICLTILKDRMWIDKGSKGLTRAMAAVTVALAYDLCYDAWSPATRQLVSKELMGAAEGLMKSMGQGANTKLANNWQAVRYGGCGLAALACDEAGNTELAKQAYPKLLAHLNANLGDNGWNPEGIGYTMYPWQFTGPFGIAASRAGVGDLRKDTKAKVSMTLWTVYADTVAIPGKNGRIGLHPDLSDDNATFDGQGTSGLAFLYVPQDYVPAARWMYDYLCGTNGDKSWDTARGGGIYSLLLYPDHIPAKNPAEIAGLNYADTSHGVALFRNAYRDGNDILTVVNAHSRQPDGCHGGPDTNTFRILGLGGCWAVGGGRTGETGGQTNLFAKSPDAPRVKVKAPSGAGLGRLKTHMFEKDGSGMAVVTGSCMGVENHTRVFGVDYSGASGAVAVFVDANTSVNGKIWRLNTPEFNTVTLTPNGFVIKSPNGATFAATVLVPAKPVLRTGIVARDNPKDTHSTGYNYRENNYKNNKWIEFDCDKRCNTTPLPPSTVKAQRLMPGFRWESAR